MLRELLRCGGANDGRTPNLGCTQEPRRKATYCIDAAVCAGESKRRKGRKGRIGGIVLRARRSCIGGFCN